MQLEESIRPHGYHATPMEQRDKRGWFVFWEQIDGPGYGSRGMNLTMNAAHELAKDIRDGKVKP